MYLVVWDERWILEGNMKLTGTQCRTRGINLIWWPGIWNWLVLGVELKASIRFDD
jgi:hypothetical protein